MSQFSDQSYLLSQQYRDSSNLNARNELHRRFSANKRGWQRWVFDQLALGPGERVLELGCGPAYLWAANLERLPAELDLTLSDFSTGMLQEAQAKLGSLRTLAFRVIDAQLIPYDDATFDVVIANHMLYHVPERPKALAEIRRVLKPASRFYASTIGRAHMQELAQLVNRFDPAIQFMANTVTGFTLENGLDQLAPFFAHIEVQRYEDALVVTEVEPLVAYALSASLGPAFSDEKLIAFAGFVAQEIAAHGAIRITKESGMFSCSTSC